MKTILKVLDKNMNSPIYGGLQYELGKEYYCQDFDDSNNECSNGFYGCNVDYLIHWFKPYKNHRLFESNVRGKSKIFETKQRWEYCSILKELSKDEIIYLCKANEERLGYKLSEVLYPVNPFLMPKRIPNDEDLALLEAWKHTISSMSDSVWNSIRDSIRDSVWNSVLTSLRDSVWYSVWYSVLTSLRDSVCDSVWNSVWNSVLTSLRDSVCDSVWNSFVAYAGSLFLKIDKWQYIDNKPGTYPFQSAVDLWNRGLVPSFDGEKWRLHSGEKAKVVWEEEK